MIGSVEINLNVIKELVDYLNRSGVEKFQLETKEFKLSLEKGGAAGIQPDTANPQQAGNRRDEPAPAGQEAAGTAAPQDVPRGNIVKSPIVGTYYSSASPDKPPFVSVGQQVKKGDTLFIIESMKLMNEIASEFTGTVAEIMLENGKPVEYGQPIMRIEA